MTSMSNSSVFSRTQSSQIGPVAVRGYLTGRRGLYALALIAAAAGLVLGGAWWGFAAILPLLYVLPCAAMMAMCMKGHGGSGQNLDAKPEPAPSLIGGHTTEETGPR